MKRFSFHKAPEAIHSDVHQEENALANPIVMPVYQMPTSTRIKITAYVIFMSVMMFLLGILFTINMQQRVITGPISVIQQPILELSHIPTQAHKQWLDLQDAIQDVDRYFYDREKIDYTKMYYAAAQSALQTLNDSYTRFEVPQVAQAMNNLINGHAGGGLGIETQIVQGKVTLVDVYPDNPGEKAGLKIGDIILQVNGQDIPHTNDPGKDLQQTADMLKGDINTTVTLSIQRPSQNNSVLVISVTRGSIERPLVETKLLPDSIGYIKLKDSFGDKTSEEFTKQVQQLVDKGAKKFVLDLRDNGGGFVESAQQVLGHFIQDGTAFYEKTWDGQQFVQNQTPVKPATTLKLYDQPLVVLVNKNSASASEITAGALQSRGRATLIGEQTYGKGVAQYVVPLEDGAAARITYAHWLTPSKLDINHNGLVPDIKIDINQTDSEAGHDTQLDRAVQFLQNGEKGNPQSTAGSNK